VGWSALHGRWDPEAGKMVQLLEGYNSGPMGHYMELNSVQCLAMIASKDHR
jgi:hypothetical protein